MIGYSDTPLLVIVLAIPERGGLQYTILFLFYFNHVHLIFKQGGNDCIGMRRQLHCIGAPIDTELVKNLKL